MQRTLSAAAVLAAALAASPAVAQSVDGRIAFRNDHVGSTMPTGNEYTIDAAGTHNFQVLFGLFDAVGFTNRGMFNYIGRIDLADPGAASSIAPRDGGGRRYPYTYGPPITDGTAGNPIRFDSNRGFGSVQLPWLEGEPMPGQPAYSSYNPAEFGSGGAPDEYFPGYRFTLNITDLTPRVIEITASGEMQAIATFSIFESSPPEDGFPGSVTYFPSSFVPDNNNSAVLRITVIPGPATGVLAALGLLGAQRRRRRAAPRLAAGALACAAAASPVAAQTFDARTSFRNDHVASTSPTGDEYTLDAAGTYDFSALFGAFNASGFTNRGLFAYDGVLTVSDPLGNAAIAPRAGTARRSPYADGPSGGVPGNPITFRAARSSTPIVIPWPVGEPMPPEPSFPSYDPAVLGTGGAPDEYFPGYRFTVTITDLTPRTVTVAASGGMAAVSQFSPFNIVPPGEEPGVVEYFASAFVNVSGQNGVLTLTIVPTPASVAAIAAGTLVVGGQRRRRSSAGRC